MFSTRTINVQLEFLLEEHTCFLGKAVIKSALTLTGGNNLGSGSHLCSHFKHSGDSYWDYWHLGWNKTVLIIVGYVASLAWRH